MDLIKCGKLLSDLRKAKGMTQKQVADKLGILPKTVSKWETGHGFPDVALISTLAEAFSVLPTFSVLPAFPVFPHQFLFFNADLLKLEKNVPETVLQVTSRKIHH